MNQPETSPSVFITGCSSGIGLDAAQTMHARGWRVFTGCRTADDAARLASIGVTPVIIDLADEASITAAVAEVLSHGPLHGLVNNAAFALPGAVEDLPRGALRAIFEVNLFGTHDLTRQLIPHFRQQGCGRIVNISSVLGLVGIRWRGAYSATKFALEGLTDVMRLEMSDTPIKVVLIEPGPITSRIRANSIPHFERWIDWQASPRVDQYRASLLRRLYEPSGPDRFELPPSAVSQRIIKALEHPNPRPRYYVTRPTFIAGIARRLLSTRLLDAFARRG